MLNYREDNRLIELKEVCEKIKSIDVRTAIKWCKKAKIPIINKGKKKFTYKFLVDAELDRTMVNYLQSNYPNSWRKMYSYYVDDDSYNYMLATIEE